MKSLSARLLAKREIVDGCWVYAGAKDRDGYGRIGVGGENFLAHRAAWIAFRGPTGGLHVLHNEGCVSRACFNPSHLHLGVHKQNMVERDDWGDGIRGERVATAKLTERDVVAIRRLRKQGITWRALGDSFGVSTSTARQAAVGLTWRHV